MPAETHRNVADLDRDELLELVRDIIFEYVGSTGTADPDALDANTTLDSLGVDDLTLIDVVEAVEAELAERTIGFVISDDELAEVKTIEDLVVALDTSRGTAS